MPAVAASTRFCRRGRGVDAISSQVAAVVYQQLFVVPRLAYKLLGPRGMAQVFGVGNDGATASIAAQTGMLFGVCAVVLGVGAAVVRKAARL